MVPRWTTMNRVALLLAGWTYKDDINPPRAYDPLPDGPFKNRLAGYLSQHVLHQTADWQEPIAHQQEFADLAFNLWPTRSN
jgi:hypothetical protein